jgi:ribonuclease P/MRP protein subunit RPP40
LPKILDKWTECLEVGGEIDVIYTDLEKAFDKVTHKRLISKLESYGVNKEIVSWIAAFLNNRRQRVKINGFSSFWTRVFSGVPQGSILSPLLFIIFINDIVECYSSCNIFLYADDSKIFKHILTPYDSVLL